MLHLTVEYFCFIQIDFNVERIVDKNSVILFVVYFEKSVSEDCVRLFSILEGCFELSFG